LNSAKIFKDVNSDESLSKLENLKNQKSIDTKIFQIWLDAPKLTSEMIGLSFEDRRVFRRR